MHLLEQTGLADRVATLAHASVQHVNLHAERGVLEEHVALVTLRGLRGDTVDIAATTPLTADFRDDRSMEGEDTASSLPKLVLTVPKLLSVLLVSARDVAAPLVFDDPKLPRLVGTTGGLGVMNARGEGAHLNAVTPRTRASSRRIRVAPADSPE